MCLCGVQDSEYEALAVTAAITLREYGHLKRLLIGGSGPDESSQDAKSPAKDRLVKKGACCLVQAMPGFVA